MHRWRLLTGSRAQADYFEAVAGAAGDAKLAANWVMGEMSGALNRDGREIEQSPIGASMLGGLLGRILDRTISGKIAKQVFEAMWQGEGTADEIIAAKGLTQITDSTAIEQIVDQVIADKLGVMDATAIVMCRDNHLPLRVFDLTRANAIAEALTGDKIGTLVSA